MTTNQIGGVPETWDMLCNIFHNEFNWPRSMELSQTNLVSGLMGLIIFPPEVEVPPGAVILPGTVVPPGAVIPPGTIVPPPPGSEIPPGAVIPPGTVVPPGAVIPPGTYFPPGGYGPPDGPQPPSWNETLPPEILDPPIVPPVDPGTPPRPPTNHQTIGEATVFYCSTSDGFCTHYDNDWNTVRNAASSVSVNSTNTGAWSGIRVTRTTTLRKYIGRTFLYFDLSALSAGQSISKAELHCFESGYHYSRVSLFQGTQGDPLTTADYDAFTGSLFDTQQWLDSGSPVATPTIFKLNAAGLTYLESVVGGTALFCLREYDHDVLNVAPLINTDSTNGILFADYPFQEHHPQLMLWL